MNTPPKNRQKSLFTLITGLSFLINTNSVQSQIIPDNTLGNENSKFTPNQVKDLIEGGAIRGNNLFHSFSEFNINNNQQVYFSNPIGINNILTRVTGNNISNIFGTLGVNGNANLFLINPNGIIFGQNAKLDIKGSFFASTANAIKFSDNNLFSAKDTNTNPLLTMSVPVGVQFGNNPTGDITNYGNLTTGKDLTLSGKNLNITESILQTGGNLTLESQSKVKIEDSINKPVILKSSGDITIQGNQSVEINTLNHNDSNITSDRDIIFRSPVRLLSNGKYTVGGYFVTEDLNGNVIDFIIPHNNVIKVNGDITLGNYTGSSLYILASGKVTLGNVLITGGEPGFTFKFIPDGQGGDQFVFVVAKNDVGSLDVRSGIDEQKLPEISENNFGLPSNAGIKTGNIINRGGNVLLTNQYKTNSNLILNSANITVGNIDTSTVDGRNGGNIALTTTGGNITTQNINSSSNGFIGTGGAIALFTTDGNIITQSIQSSFRNIEITGSNLTLGNIQNPSGNVKLITNSNMNGENINFKIISTRIFNANNSSGGAVYIDAKGNITGNQIATDTSNGNNAKGGDITLLSGGNVLINGGTSLEQIGVRVGLLSGSDETINGTAGNILIKAEGNIDINPNNNSLAYGGINASVIRRFSDNVGHSGNIELTSNNGNITVNQGIFTNTTAENGFLSGNSGNIILNAAIGNVNVKSNQAGAMVTRTRSISQTGNAGKIEINARNINIQGRFRNNSDLDVTTQSNRTGIGGDIIFNSQNPLNLTYLTIGTDGLNGKGGAIKITAPEITLDQVRMFTKTSGTGQAGDVEITANQGSILFKNQSFISASSEFEAKGNGGTININSKDFQLTQGSFIDASTAGSGKAGNINLNITNSINIFGVNSKLSTSTKSTGTGGNIDILTNSFRIADNAILDAKTSGVGDGGNIKIISDTFNIVNGGKLQGTTSSSGKAGNMIITSTNSANLDQGSIKVNAIESGNAGNLMITTKELNLNNNSEISASTNTGIGQDITVQNLENLTVKNDSIISASTTNGKAGNLQINQGQNPVLNINLNQGKLNVEANGTGDSGTVDINANNLNLDNNSKISASTISGTGQNINLQNILKLSLESSIISTSTDTGKAGSVNINNQQNPVNSVQLNNSTIEAAAKGNNGEAGSLIINAKKLTLDNNTNITASNFSGQNGGNIQVENLETLDITNSQISASTTTGNAGSIHVNVNNDSAKSVNIKGENSSVNVRANAQGGNAGSINLNTRALTMKDNAEISASNVSGKSQDITLENLNTLEVNQSKINATTTDGTAGNLKIKATDSVKISNNSELSTDTFGSGNAGSIEIITNNFQILENSQISATSSGSGKGGNITVTSVNFNGLSGGRLVTSTSGSGDAGNIKINTTEIVNLDGENTGLFASTELGSTGKGGSINVDPTEVILTNNAKISVDSQGSGNGGNLRIQSGIIKLDNNSILSAATKNGEGGNIILDINNYLLMRNNSQISAKADNTANGGNVEIKAPFIISVFSENNDIIANAFKGRGGRILITTDGIFGLKFLPRLTTNSDINASSEFGVNGTIEINTPGIDPTSGLTQLPSIPIDLSALINNSCQVAKRNSFTVAGKGGIPSSPNDIFTADITVGDWGKSSNIYQKSPLISENTLQKEKTNKSKEIREVQGIIKDKKGNIILTFNSVEVTENGVYLRPLDCERLLKSVNGNQ